MGTCSHLTMVQWLSFGGSVGVNTLSNSLLVPWWGLRVCAWSGIMRCVSSNICSPCPSIVAYKFSASCPTRTAEAWQSAGLVLVDVEFFFLSTDLRGIREALFSFGFFFQDATVRLPLETVSHMVIRLFARLVYHIELLSNQHF